MPCSSERAALRFRPEVCSKVGRKCAYANAEWAGRLEAGATPKYVARYAKYDASNVFAS